MTNLFTTVSLQVDDEVSSVLDTLGDIENPPKWLNDILEEHDFNTSWEVILEDEQVSWLRQRMNEYLEEMEAVEAEPGEPTPEQQIEPLRRQIGLEEFELFCAITKQE
jgi:hypothetical protein